MMIVNKVLLMGGDNWSLNLRRLFNLLIMENLRIMHSCYELFTCTLLAGTEDEEAYIREIESAEGADEGEHGEDDGDDEEDPGLGELLHAQGI